MLVDFSKAFAIKINRAHLYDEKNAGKKLKESTKSSNKMSSDRFAAVRNTVTNLSSLH